MHSFDLEFLSGSKMVRTVPLEYGRPLVIGRSPDTDVAFDDIVVLSRRHCRVWVEEGRAWLEPLNCRCSILVNGEAIRASHEVKVGDKVLLAGEHLRIRLRSIPASSDEQCRSRVMNDPEATGQESPGPPAHRHISMEEKVGVGVVRFIDLKGDLESRESIAEIRHELEELVDQNPAGSLILDFECKYFFFSDVFFSHLAGLFVRKNKRAKGTLKLCSLPPEVVDVLRFLHLDQVFPPFKSFDDAIAGKAPDPSQLS